MPSPTPRHRAPLLWLLLPFMAGISATRFFPAPTTHTLPLLLLASGLLAGAAVWFSLRPGRAAGVGWSLCTGIAVGLAGFIYLHLRNPHWRETSDRPPREVTVTLAVEQVYPAAPTARNFTGCGVIIAAGPTEQALLGRRVYFSALRKISLPPARSGCYLMRGIIEPLPAAPAPLSFDDYLANLGIRQKFTRGQILSEETPPGWLAQVCSRTADRFAKVLGHGIEAHPVLSSLYAAMLLGGKAGLSAEQQNAFMRSGTFHVFSISGLHVGVIAGAICSLFRLLRISPRTTVALSLPILWFYVQVTGAGYPALRALVMISFFLGARVLRQPMNGLAALTAAALATLIYEPLQLFSSGFQMSYIVVLALVVMGAPLATRWQSRWRPFRGLPRAYWRWWQRASEWTGHAVLGASAACWVAFLASIPAGIGYFQLFAPGSLLANLLVIPLSSLAITGGFLSLLCGLGGLLSLSFLFNRAATITLLLTDALLQNGTRLPGICFSAHFRETWMTPVALALTVAVLLAGHGGRWSARYGGYWPPVATAVIILLGVRFG